MTEQGSLFDMAPRRQHAPYARNSETSIAAADRIAPKAHGKREEVFSAILTAGARGATRKELEVSTGFLTQTLCARLNELEQSGRIRKQYSAVFERKENGEVLQKAVPSKRNGCAVYVCGRVAVRGAA